MRIASLGVMLHHPAVARVDIFSETTLLDFDAVIIDTDGVVTEMLAKVRNKEDYRVTNEQADTLRYYLGERKRQIKELQELGRPLIAFCSTTKTIYVKGDEPDIDIAGYLPGAGKAFHSEAGESIVFQGPQPYKAFAEALQGRLRYTAVLDPCPGVPLFFLKGTKKALGAIIAGDKPWLLLSPRVKPNQGMVPVKESNAYKFVEAAIQLFAARPVPGTDFVAPAWQSSFVLKPERPFLERREAERKALHDAEAKLLETEKSLKALDQLKRAFTAKSEVLVETVALLMRMLGFKVEPGPEVKDDLIAKGHGLVFVLEVKGRDKSGSGEKDARQLESWVSRYHYEHDTEPEPKGLLVVNGYKDLPLDERKEPTFPHPMIDYLKRKQLCAVTGTQLLCLALEAQERGNQGDIAAELAATSGLFTRYQTLAERDEWVRGS